LNAVSPIPEKPRPVRGFSFLDRARDTPAGTWLLGVLCGLLYAAATVAVRWKPAYTDETTHFAQIWLFAHGQWRVLPELTTIPGYHLVSAGLLYLFGDVSLQGARMLSAAFGLLAAAGFHAVRTRLWPGTQSLATVQFLVLPILVPLYFLAYTDVFALALLLWATWACVCARHWLAAALLVALVCVRQHEVVWTGLLAAFALRDAGLRDALRDWRRVVPTILPYALPVAGFLVFWCWNGSISLSHSQAALHPDLSLHAGNVLFALVVAGVLLPLQTAQGFARAAHAIARRPLLGALVVALLFGFWFLFRADNPYNGAFPQFYLHNRLPLLIEQRPWIRSIASMVATAAACAFAATPLRPLRGRWLFAFATLFLAASWLVELRYVAVPLVLWLAMREHRSRAVEVATFALWLALAVWIMSGVLAQRFFL